MGVFSNPAFDDHERVVFCHDAATGLSSIIAIHSTTRGPGAGGCRLWAYADEDAALTDVLRLSQGMSYKNAMAELPLGGGKAVIIKHSDFTGSDALYERFGEFVESLGGAYITAEDMGMSEAIMQVIGSRTSYVSGLPAEGGAAGGDPSPKTALGIYAGIRTAVEFRDARSSLSGLRVAVQGVGNVGYNLCKLLHADGAILLVADMDEARVARAVSEFDATPVGLDDVLSVDADVLAPCAMGAVLTEESIPDLRVGIVAGGANNQLAAPGDGQRLHDAGILYAPDYVINAGGIINVACEYQGGFTDADVDESVMRIGARLKRIFERSADNDVPTNRIADAQARRFIGRN
ncbi:MAG: Glu/Leu/Phe/Val dehydrogenase dimerization domain-containing protein [Woeseiaceae bacterium]|nr:Glu/Leu/Phe/Val dehydrogenase dimerization domain-containing protein [Woeseiaceae bacterium]